MRTKSAMNLMELEAKVLRNPQIHMYRNLSDCVQEHHLEDEVEFEGHLCLNACSDGPNLSIDGVRYQHVDSDVVTDLLEKALAKRRGEA